MKMVFLKIKYLVSPLVKIGGQETIHFAFGRVPLTSYFGKYPENFFMMVPPTRRNNPRIITVPIHGSSNGGGISCCCCCRCCSCIHLNFLRTSSGRLKLAEVLLGFFCQSIAFQYGTNYSSKIGFSLQSFVSNVTWCFLTTFLLLICYLFSPKSINLIKSSLFEVLFNIIAAFTFLTTCSYLGYVVNMVLEPVSIFQPNYEIYPAMSAAYMTGTILGLLYAYDAYKSYKYFKGYRY